MASQWIKRCRDYLFIDGQEQRRYYAWHHMRNTMESEHSCVRKHFSFKLQDLAVRPHPVLVQFQHDIRGTDFLPFAQAEDAIRIRAVFANPVQFRRILPVLPDVISCGSIKQKSCPFLWPSSNEKRIPTRHFDDALRPDLVQS